MVKKTDIVLPDDIYNIFLKPLAQRMGIRYLPRNSSLLLRSIFKKLSEKAEILDTKRLKEIQKSVEKIVGPVQTIIEIFATFAKPLLALIPPQYMAIAMGILTFVPLFIIGLVVLYYLENWVKVPFVWSTREFDAAVPEVLRGNTLRITQRTKRTLTMPLVKWLDFKGTDKLDYFYEAPNDLRVKLKALELVTEKYPDLTSKKITSMNDQELDELEKIIANIPMVGFEIDFQEEITLSKHTIRGWRKVLPPIMTRTVAVIKSLFEKVRNNALTEFQEKPARTIAKYMFIGWLGFLK